MEAMTRGGECADLVASLDIAEISLWKVLLAISHYRYLLDLYPSRIPAPI